MATAADSPQAIPNKSATPGRKGLGLTTVLLLMLVSIAASGGVAWFVANQKAGGAEETRGEDEHGAPAATPAPAAYLALEPAFVVNLEDPDIPRYLQVDMQVMSRDSLALETVRTHLPRIRNSLLMLFAQKRPIDLSSREGKEQLRADCLSEIQKVMQEETGKPVVEAVYFTSFVMQ